MDTPRDRINAVVVRHEGRRRFLSATEEEHRILRLARERRRLKTAPKLYKTAPRKSGRKRLEAKAIKLHVELQRLAANAKYSDADRAWAEGLAEGIRRGMFEGWKATNT